MAPATQLGLLGVAIGPDPASTPGRPGQGSHLRLGHRAGGPHRLLLGRDVPQLLLHRRPRPDDRPARDPGGSRMVVDRVELAVMARRWRPCRRRHGGPGQLSRTRIGRAASLAAGGRPRPRRAVRGRRGVRASRSGPEPAAGAHGRRGTVGRGIRAGGHRGRRGRRRTWALCHPLPVTGHHLRDPGGARAVPVPSHTIRARGRRPPRKFRLASSTRRPLPEGSS
jgi:hypothetical protein